MVGGFSLQRETEAKASDTTEQNVGQISRRAWIPRPASLQQHFSGWGSHLRQATQSLLGKCVRVGL